MGSSSFQTWPLCLESRSDWNRVAPILWQSGVNHKQQDARETEHYDFRCFPSLPPAGFRSAPRRPQHVPPSRAWNFLSPGV